MTERMDCKKLTDDEYAKFFVTFKSHSDQDKVISNLIMQELSEYSNKPIDIMSIGAGTGFLEDRIIRHFGISMNSILAIEPNSVHLENLRQMGAKWNNVIWEIDSSYFDVNYQTEKRFDVILMVHSIYGIQNPIESIIKAKSFLKTGGKCLIFVHGEKGGFQFSSKIYGKVLMAPFESNSSTITGGYLSECLQKNNIKLEATKITVQLDVTDFVERNRSPIRDDIVSFLLHTKYMDLSKEVQEVIHQTVKEGIMTDANGRHLFQAENYMIVI